MGFDVALFHSQKHPAILVCFLLALKGYDYQNISAFIGYSPSHFLYRWSYKIVFFKTKAFLKRRCSGSVLFFIDVAEVIDEKFGQQEMTPVVRMDPIGDEGIAGEAFDRPKGFAKV